MTVRNALLSLSLLFASPLGMAEDTPPAKAAAAKPATTEGATAANAAATKGPKVISGMSILGNQEAPKSLVIVPWKSSEIADSVGIATLLDDSRQPVDRDVFARELAYYEVRSGTPQ
ncbi:MAG TPA: hypothetical protein VNS57_06130 [Steroidobacteraceae bacterium]|nr:hypothetical protein [Steroidobacteraceae bacterium]